MVRDEPRILLVEGSAAGESSLAPALRKGGYRLRIANTGREALHWGQENVPDLIVYDASYMRSGGRRTCRWLKEMLGDTPMIHVRLEGQPEEPRAGADVYLVQPFSARKLLNRVRALLPTDSGDEEVIRAGPLTVFLGKRSVEIVGLGERRMTPKVTALLLEFLRQPGTVLTRQQLFREVWKTDFLGDTRTLDVHIRWARESIEADPASPQLLRTVRGVGYIFSVPTPDGLGKKSP
jgi:DNA-binding response OmpR family regulator